MKQQRSLKEYIKQIRKEVQSEGLSTEYVDHEELYMVMGDLRKICDLSNKLYIMLKKNPSGLEEWNQIKISKATDYISSVYDYLMYTNVGDDYEE